jgi:hypothetical protein
MTDSFAGKDQVPAGQQAPQPDHAANLAGLTAEQLAAIVKRDQHAQEHIRRLEDEARQRREQEQAIADRLTQLEAELSKRASLEELLAKREGAQPNKSDSQTPAVDVDSVVQRVLSTMEQKTVAERTKANRAAAVEAAKSVYGDSYKQKVEETAKELGMTLNDVDDLAGRSPQAFARMFGLQAQADKRRPDVSPGVNTAAVANQPRDVDTELAQVARENRKALFGKESFDKIAQSLKR